MADRLTERQRLTWLTLSGLPWLVSGVCYLAMSDARRAFPDFVGILFLISAVATWLLALRPSSALAFRVAGSTAIAALLARVVSLIMGLLFASDPDAVWLAGSGLATTILIIALYGKWWIVRVQPWHESHRRRE